MMEFLTFMFSSFWKFAGCAILLSGAANVIIIMWNRFFRHWNIRKHGYPPSYCDADGDFKTEDE
jgi:hypothetical protein